MSELATQKACPKCGVGNSGSFCSSCGTQLDASGRGAWMSFIDSFWNLREWPTYVRTYRRILNSPTRNTIALFEEGNSTAAFLFLQKSTFLYTVAIFANIFGGGAIFSELVVPLLLLASMSAFLAMFGFLARRKSGRGRTNLEFLTLASFVSGFTIPLSIPLEFLLIFAPLSLSARLLVAVLLIPLMLYVVRVWAYFWDLPKSRIFAYLMIVGLTGSTASFLIALVTLFVLLPPA
jgi:hypothetical protein